MKKNKGFTLIELLAVIVILAVIALIATPIIIGIIEDSKLKAYENSAYGIIDSAKYYYAQGLLKPENSVEYDKDVLGKLSYDGQKPKAGSTTFINQNGEVAVALLYGNKCYLKEYSEEKLKDGDPKNCKVTISSSSSTLSDFIVRGPIVTTGSGLYKMSNTEYRYRGGCANNSNTCADAEPINNYISIGGQKYRIISVDSQGIKVITEKRLSSYQNYDKGVGLGETCTENDCPRNNANNTFCQVTGRTYWGCSVYAAVSGNFTAGLRTGTVTQNSSLYDYLNTTGTDAEVTTLREKALSAIWNIGAVVKQTNALLSTVTSQEKGNMATFKMGLMNTSDYINGSLDTECQTDPFNFSGSSKSNNWLFDSASSYPWTLNPWTMADSKDFEYVWSIQPEGYLFYNNVIENGSVRPVAYLSSSTLVSSGDGTSANPWIIE